MTWQGTFGLLLVLRILITVGTRERVLWPQLASSTSLTMCSIAMLLPLVAYYNEAGYNIKPRLSLGFRSLERNSIAPRLCHMLYVFARRGGGK